MENQDLIKTNNFFSNMTSKSPEEVLRIVINFVSMTHEMNRATIYAFLNEYCKEIEDYSLLRKTIRTYARIDNGEDKDVAIKKELDGNHNAYLKHKRPVSKGLVEKAYNSFTKIIENIKMESTINAYTSKEDDAIELQYDPRRIVPDEKFLRVIGYANYIIAQGVNDKFAREYLGLQDDEIEQAKLWKEIYLSSNGPKKTDRNVIRDEK